eukprot:GHVS01033915.1.p1 GENE.GHVS01033915.1~~GHVS01033915.1.p1  ORF type:complete len:160 (-),score=20.32 GHVS01033915.1:145-624(-)
MEEDGEGQMTLSLLETKAMMLNELERMHVTHEHLVKSSKHISQNDQIFAQYASAASSAGSLLSYMKRRSEMDSLWVWYSFVFFVAVCVFIIGKRLTLWRFMFGLVWLTVSCVFTVLQAVTDVILHNFQLLYSPQHRPSDPMCPIPPLTMYRDDSRICWR